MNDNRSRRREIPVRSLSVSGGFPGFAAHLVIKTYCLDCEGRPVFLAVENRGHHTRNFFLRPPIPERISSMLFFPTGFGGRYFSLRLGTIRKNNPQKLA